MADNGKRLHNKSLAVDGFKEKFVMGSQRGEVYSHIASHAGAVLIGDSYIYSLFGYFGMGATSDVFDGKAYTGNQASHLALSRDISDMEKTSGFGDEALERSAEVFGDYAGRDIGLLMRKASNGQINRANLRSSIFNTLCDN